VAGVVASSGWEHVNVFERLENNVIVGFHSWIYLFNEEQDGDFNYLGYIQTVDTGLSFQFPSICTAAPSRPLN
jgi:poly(U)-specific endoribonuclease